MFSKAILCAVLLLSLPSAGSAQSGAIMIEDAYARSSTPSATSGAIFLQLMNHGSDDHLAGVASSVAKRVELHMHNEDENGIMRMLHVEDGFAVPSGEVVALERGGKHIMLLGLIEPLENGATFPLTLRFKEAGEITIDVIVDRDRKPTRRGDRGGHEHSGHDNNTDHHEHVGQHGDSGHTVAQD